MKRFLILFSLVCLSIYVYGYDIEVDKEGYSNGKHWEMITDTDKYGTGMPGNGRGLRVDGVMVISCQNYAMDSVTIGKTIYFEVKRYKSDEHRKLYNLSGERVLSFEFDLIYKGGTYGNLNGLYEFCKKDNDVYRNYLCDSKLNIIKSGYEIAKECKYEGHNEKYILLIYKRGDSYEHELYTRDWKLALPRHKFLEQTKDRQGNFKYWYIEDCNGYEGRLDSNWNWIIPLEKRFSDIYETKIAGINYYSCKKGGYWGLYDTKLNEIIAPDYEELDVFDDTNFIKFKLNGFWGVMTLQGRTTKTIIPTTRGYTNISRYVKSQKRFMYEMNGYKGECDATGRQISKIKVETPRQSVASSSSSRSSSSSSSSSSSGSSSSSNSGSGTTQTVVVEHHRDPIPVQEWQQCVACFGSGQCPYVKCGGSGWYYIGDRASTCGMCHGSGKCSTCAGKGGHYVTVYR